jgi:hypothetical protein
VPHSVNLMRPFKEGTDAGGSNAVSDPGSLHLKGRSPESFPPSSCNSPFLPFSESDRRSSTSPVPYRILV